MAHPDTVVTTPAGPRAAGRSKDNRAALAQRQRPAAGLGAGTVLEQKKFAAAIVAFGAREQHGGLQREHHLAVQVLMQAIVASGFITQQQRRGASLPVPMAERDEIIE